MKRVRPGANVRKLSSASAATMSKPSTSDASPSPSRCVRSAGVSGAICRWLYTAPFFCDRPVMSYVLAALPSRCAAIASTAPTVMTPVPPMPGIITPKASPFSGAGVGSGSAAKASSGDAAGLSFFGWPPCTVTKLGQKPFTQE